MRARLIHIAYLIAITTAMVGLGVADFQWN
jgi:hypothetical protein